MKRTLAAISHILVLLLCCLPAHAEFHPIKIFSLSDGTTIRGELSGIRTSDGAYVIESPKLGTVAIQAEDIVSMVNEGAAITPDRSSDPAKSSAQPASSSMTLAPGMMQQTQAMLMADPSINEAVQEIMADPELVELFMDPELMQAITSMDAAALQSNPRVQQLMQDPRMQQLMQQAAQKMMTQNGLTP